MPCEMCTDPDGVPCFPMYGLGPHTHKPGPLLGSTVMDQVQAAPGFTPSADEPGMGIWWCPHCGDGRPSDDTFPAPERADSPSEAERPTVQAGAATDNLFELWWADYMPEAARDLAWRAYSAALPPEGAE